MERYFYQINESIIEKSFLPPLPYPEKKMSVNNLPISLWTTYKISPTLQNITSNLQRDLVATPLSSKCDFHSLISNYLNLLKAKFWKRLQAHTFGKRFQSNAHNCGQHRCSIELKYKRFIISWSLSDDKLFDHCSPFHIRELNFN